MDLTKLIAKIVHPGKMLYLEKLDEGCLYSKRLCILTTGKSNILETFKIIHKGKRFSVRAKETTGWIPDFDEQEKDNSESEDEQSIGFIKEDFDGSGVEKEWDNNVSMVPDSVKEDVNVQAEEKGDISYQEIKRAVWDCGIDKSPEPDGVTFGFIRRYWSLIEKDVVATVQHFFTSGNFPKGCNASFIALIPKIPDAKLVKDFRPISLIRSLYKIIAKILANRLVGVLGDLVSEVQSAIVADRQILDGPLILNEVMQPYENQAKIDYMLRDKNSMDLTKLIAKIVHPCKPLSTH
nr:RNA-directed DNA polymerase, eukaryota, reverse transcriptase zinc-binding domain protein [Tanacetum cinerariifolium]